MRRDSRRAQGLLIALRRLGEDVSLRQLERLGEFGLLGSDADEVTPALVERAREALDLVEEHRSGAKAVLVMFVRGHEFDKNRLEHAYLTALERAEVWIKATAGSVGGYAAAEHLAWKLAQKGSKSAEERPIRERLKLMRSGRRFVTLKQSMASAYTDAVLILTDGRASSDQSLRELLQATGVDAITREALPGQPPPARLLPIEQIKQMLKHIRLGSQVAAVTQASYRQLRTARDDTVSLAGFARVFAPVAQRAFGLPEAFGFAEIAKLSELALAFMIPPMIFVRAVKGQELDRIKETIELHTPRFEAINELIDEIPARFYPLNRTVSRIANEELPAEDRAELVAVIDEFEANHPAKYALITSDVKPLPSVKYSY